MIKKPMLHDGGDDDGCCDGYFGDGDDETDQGFVVLRAFTPDRCQCYQKQ